MTERWGLYFEFPFESIIFDVERFYVIVGIGAYCKGLIEIILLCYK